MQLKKTIARFTKAARDVIKKFRGKSRGDVPIRPPAYPESHSEALEWVLRVVDIIGARPSITDDEIVASLVRDGANKVDAELLVRFVPCAMSFALLKKMGVSEFPSTFCVKNDEDSKWIEFPLASEHYFMAALGVGHEIVTNGYTERINKETYSAVVGRSAEIGAVNNLLNSGAQLAGGVLAHPCLIGISAEQIAASRTRTH